VHNLQDELTAIRSNKLKIVVVFAGQTSGTHVEAVQFAGQAHGCGFCGGLRNAGFQEHPGILSASSAMRPCGGAASLNKKGDPNVAPSQRRKAQCTEAGPLYVLR